MKLENIHVHCSACEKHVGFGELASIRINISIPSFSADNKFSFHRQFDFRTTGLCQECIEKISGNKEIRSKAVLEKKLPEYLSKVVLKTLEHKNTKRG